MFKCLMLFLFSVLLFGCASLPSQDIKGLETRVKNLEDDNLRLQRLIDNLTLRMDALSLRIDQFLQGATTSVPKASDSKSSGNEVDSGGNVSTTPEQKKPKSSSQVQCSATTKKGKRCSRMTSSPNGLCWQHGGN